MQIVLYNYGLTLKLFCISWHGNFDSLCNLYSHHAIFCMLRIYNALDIRRVFYQELFPNLLYTKFQKQQPFIKICWMKHVSILLEYNRKFMFMNTSLRGNAFLILFSFIQRLIQGNNSFNLQLQNQLKIGSQWLPFQFMNVVDNLNDNHISM